MTTQKKKVVVSFFDGISGAQMALKKLNIPCVYLASEIDKHAIKVTQKNFPKTLQLGDVRKISQKSLEMALKRIQPFYKDVDLARPIDLFINECEGMCGV